MKSIFGVAALLTLSSVHAQDLSFGDLNYFFKHRELNLRAQVDYQREVDSQDSQDTLTEGFRPNLMTYGLHEKVNVFAKLGYDLSTSVRDITVVKVQDAPSYSKDGLRNPELGADYRLHNQSEMGYNVDLGLLASLKFQDSEDGDDTSGVDGNAVDPRSSLAFNAKIGRKWNEANEWRAYVGVRLNGSGEQDLPSGNKLSLDSSMDFLLGGYYQYRPIPEFMMTVGLEGTRFGETDGDVQAIGLTQEAYIDLNGRFVAKYLVLENMIVRFDFSQGVHRSEFEITNSLGTASNVSGRRLMTFGLGVDYLF
jgi:hypothetical protein